MTERQRHIAAERDRLGPGPLHPGTQRPLHPQHQQQVLQAVDRAKQVTVGELNSLLGVSHPSPPLQGSPICPQLTPFPATRPLASSGHPLPLQQQNQLQPLSHAPPAPLTPRPAGLVGTGASGLLALSGALAAQAQLAAAAKEDRVGVDAEGSRGEWVAPGDICQDRNGEGKG